MPGCGEGAEIASARNRPDVDVRREFAVAADRGRHLPAEHRGERFAASGERDVVHPRRIDANGRRDQAGEDVVGPAGRTTGPRHG